MIEQPREKKNDKQKQIRFNSLKRKLTVGTT